MFDCLLLSASKNLFEMKNILCLVLESRDCTILCTEKKSSIFCTEKKSIF